jgi:hypothetical protein
MVYVVERYLPGERRVRYRGSTIVLGNEACFCQFEGPSEAAVAEANRNAGLSFDRIVPAVTVRPHERRTPMTVSPSIPATIEIKRSRLLGIIVGVAAIAAAVTWALVTLVVGTDTSSPQASTQTARSTSLTPVQLATVNGGSDAVLEALGFGPQEKQFVEGIVTLAKAQQAAAASDPELVLNSLRLDPTFKQFVRGISSLARAQQAAASEGRGTALDPTFKQFAEGISSLAKAQQEAASTR